MSENKVLATVYGEQITEADVESFIAKLPDEQKRYSSNAQFRANILDNIINMKLLYNYGKENELEKSEKYIELLEAVKSEILTQVAVQTIMAGCKVTDEEVKAYYDEHPEQFMEESYVAAKHILMDDEAKINEVMAEIEAGTKSFEDAAKECSTCPSAAKGGDLGKFGHGQMVPEFDKAAFEAEVGKVVGPVKTQFGYHLILVYDKKDEALKSFEEVKDTLTGALLENAKRKAYTAKLTELREKGLK